MPNFFLLDHSLKTTGGHHFDYATRMGEAAEEAGFHVTIATNRRFRNRSIRLSEFRVTTAFPKHWEIVRPFAHHMYSDYCAHNGWSLGPIGLDGEILACKSVDQTNHPNSDTNPPAEAARDTTQADRANRLRRFDESCEAVFARSPATPNDVVFLPSMTEFDMLGLARFLRRNPWTQSVPFHVQVHFGMCEVRETEYKQHANVFANVERQLQNALEQLHRHKLFFYATTQRLAEQFNTLHVCEFDSLAYPINPAFESHKTSDRVAQQSPSVDDKATLRISSAGAVRKEKGQQFLRNLIKQLWTDGFEHHKLQLAVQCKPKRMSLRPRLLASDPDSHGDSNSSKARFRRPSESSSDRIVYCRHPLGENDYVDFIRNSDIGLLMYDSQRYYARHAGVMGEYLASGIPVIVPAGCWLSDQLEQPIQSYRDSLWGRSKSELLQANETRTIPSSSSNLIYRVECRCSSTPQRYIQLRTHWTDAQDRVMSTEEEIVALPATRVAYFMSSNPLNASRFRIEMESAFDKHELNIAKFEYCPIGRDSTSEESSNDANRVPMGQVGLIAANVGEVPRLVQDIVAHYTSYRESAGEFATAWYEAHRPSETLHRLLERAQATSKRMRAA